jgi:hypothetical protein
MTRWILRVPLSTLLLLVSVVLAGCRDSDDEKTETPPDPAKLVQEAADKIDQAESFRLELRQEGPPTEIKNELDLDVTFSSADAIFVRPNRLRARVSVAIGAVTQDVQVVAVGDSQYTNNRFLTNDEWLAMTFAASFSPGDLQSAENGIGHALRTIQDIELVGREDLDGIPVYHLRGLVDASRVRSVTVGLIGTEEGKIELDVYIRTKDSFLARIVLKEPLDPNAETGEQRIWNIDFTGYNNYDASQVEEPEATARPTETPSQ